MEYSDDWVSLSNLGFSDYECHKSGVIRRRGYKKHIGYKDKKGKYLLVEMTRNKIKMPAMNVDTIILTTFKGSAGVYDDGPSDINSEVIHINHDTMDSNILNLRWGSKEEKIAIENAIHIPLKEEPTHWISLSNLGFPDYECHKSGLIRRIGKMKTIAHEDPKSKYSFVELRNAHGYKKKFKINTIICTIFHGNPPNNNSEVIHIDNNPSNLTAGNLKWASPYDKLFSERSIFRSDDYIRNISLANEYWQSGDSFGYSGYRASTLGRIYSEKVGKILEGWSYATDGYIKLKIMLNNKATDISAHIMICTIFHGHKPHSTYTVDHIDRVKTNNTPSNLRWASKSEQALNRNIKARTYLIAQIQNNKIVDFFDKQTILEIFDVDDIIIPPEGIFHSGYLWISEKFTNLDLVNEVWRSINIKGAIYSISNMGRVITTRKKFGSTNTDGYKQVGLVGQTFYMHRLVMIAFNGIIGDGLVVNHIDSDRTNNRLDNLEIVTYSGNSIHAVSSGSKSAIPVCQISLDGNIMGKFLSIQNAADATGINPKNIGNCANGVQFTAGGFRWQHI